MIKGSLMLHLGPIWYHSEPSDVPYSQNLPRPISWFRLFLQQNDSNYYISYNIDIFDFWYSVSDFWFFYIKGKASTDFHVLTRYDISDFWFLILFTARSRRAPISIYSLWYCHVGPGSKAWTSSLLSSKWG